MNNPVRSAKRSGPWYTLLPCEQELATAVLQALWFPLFDSTHIELAFDARLKTLRCITTWDAYRQALRDYLAFVRTGGVAAGSVAVQTGNAGAR